MNAEDIINNTDPREIRNILRRMKVSNEAFQRPVPNIVINQAPQQFPPSVTMVNVKMPWYNVRDYGAIGDGSTDDTAAINTAIAALNTAGRGVLYFPAGSYLCSSALTTITASVYVIGDGTTSIDKTGYGTKILCSSGTADLFNVSGLSASFYNLALINTAASTPTTSVAMKTTRQPLPPVSACWFGG